MFAHPSEEKISIDKRSDKRYMLSDQKGKSKGYKDCTYVKCNLLFMCLRRANDLESHETDAEV